MLHGIGFVIVAVILAFSAFSVVTSRDLVRAVLWLASVLCSTAILFVFLKAGFLAAVQILLYAGGIITLMLFGVMLTHRFKGNKIMVTSKGHLKGALVALSLFGLMAWSILSSDLTTVTNPEAVYTAKEIGVGFMTDWLLPMEILSVLLLAVMIGAIALSRSKDPS